MKINRPPCQVEMLPSQLYSYIIIEVTQVFVKLNEFYFYFRPRTSSSRIEFY